jgi:hypothetical protein
MLDARQFGEWEQKWKFRGGSASLEATARHSGTLKPTFAKEIIVVSQESALKGAAAVPGFPTEPAYDPFAVLSNDASVECHNSLLRKCIPPT